MTALERIEALLQKADDTETNGDAAYFNARAQVYATLELIAQLAQIETAIRVGCATIMAAITHQRAGAESPIAQLVKFLGHELRTDTFPVVPVDGDAKK